MKFTVSSLKKVYFCTGARNHSLLKTFSGDLSFEYDERIASFKALGLAKLGAPVGVCTTSGTAVAECVPAMLEAFYSQTPLVLITGDRPKKMHGTGAPQTIDHEALTRSCRGSFFEISLDQYQDLIIENPQYPIHINVLIDDTKEHGLPIRVHHKLDEFKTFLNLYKRPLFLFSHEANSMRAFIEKFSQYHLPFYAETLSGGHDLSPIKTELELIKLFKNKQFDCVIRIGHTPLSKVWRLLESEILPTFSFDSRGMSGLSYGEILPFSSQDLLANQPWWDLLKTLNFDIPKQDGLGLLKGLLTQYPDSELSYLKLIHDQLKEEDQVYLGNSLVIRFFEMIQDKNLSIFANRGVNGIDGQISSAIGIAEGSQKITYAILGDITTFYDLSALSSLPKNLKLLIINNKGGRIFDVLKLDKKIVMEHDKDFSKIAQGFGLDYAQNDFSLQKQVIEFTPSKIQTEALLKEWNT
ncbi:MAG: thiamine pyrophosphate-binding protein [Bacteriovoracaceae bacterium]